MSSVINFKNAEHIANFNELSINEKNMLEKAYLTLVRLELIDYFKNYKLPEEKGYMNCKDPIIEHIIQSIAQDYPSHSGGSLSHILRILELILPELN